MARKIKAKLIMELREQGMSRRSIAQTRHMSMGSVCEVFDIADERGITWEQVRGMGDEQVYGLFYPDRNTHESVFEEPDWSYVHAELAKVGVNLRLLHDEYKAQCAREHKVAMGSAWQRNLVQENHRSPDWPDFPGSNKVLLILEKRDPTYQVSSSGPLRYPPRLNIYLIR